MTAASSAPAARLTGIGDELPADALIDNDSAVLYFDSTTHRLAGRAQVNGTMYNLYPRMTVLATDVANADSGGDAIADVTGLSFAVTAGTKYKFRFVIPYTSAATTTGSRWSINGPASPTLLNYTSHYALTATSETVNYATAYDIPAAANATSLTAGNVATIEGVIVPSASGTVIARFASEVGSSAVTAKAGASVTWEIVG